MKRISEQIVGHWENKPLAHHAGSDDQIVGNSILLEIEIGIGIEIKP